MGFNDLARLYLNKLTAKKDQVFTYPVEEQKQFLASFPTNDDYDRSRSQYLAQSKLNGVLRSVFFNLICIPVYWKHKIRTAKKKFELIRKYDLVFHIYNADRSLIPESLLQEFPNHYFSESDNMALNSQDLLFIKDLKQRYPNSYYFISKIIAKMAIYRAIIQQYQPGAIATCSEYSFTSSVLTLWLEEQNIEHINFMHGEKLFYARDSFARFSRFYVWDNYYVELLSKLYFPKHSFIVEIPPGLKTEHNKYKNQEIDLIYYLANETAEELKIIIEAMNILQQKGMKIKLRGHPRYSDYKYLEKNCPPGMLEEKISLEESLSSTKMAASLYSTVLQQAYAKGINIVIDDLKDKKKYQKIIELEYIMLKRPHMLLSQLITEKVQKE